MNKYAVLIGNSQFPDESDKSKLPDLACPENDVDGLSTVLASERGEFEVLSLKNQPSHLIQRELQRKVKQADSEDLLLIYYSGHGKPNKSGLLHLTTLDTVIAELETSAIPINRVYDILGTGKAKKVVILLDCCFSGAAGQGFKGAVDDQLQQLNNARGTYLVTASTELQVAHESAEEGLSLFTKHLIAGLQTGEADKDGDGWVSMNELYDYVQGKVVAENPAQQPTKHVKEERGGLFIAKSGRDFRKEQVTKLKPYFLDLAKDDRITHEILADVLRIIEITNLEQLSVIDKEKEKLINEVFKNKNTINFIRKWDRLEIEPPQSQIFIRITNGDKLEIEPPQPPLKKRSFNLGSIVLASLVTIGISGFVGIWKVSVTRVPRAATPAPAATPAEPVDCIHWEDYFKKIEEAKAARKIGDTKTAEQHEATAKELCPTL